MNPQPSDLESDALPVELRAYSGRIRLGLLVQGMPPTPLAVPIETQFPSGVVLVSLGVVVAVSALTASKSDVDDRFALLCHRATALTR